MSPECWRAVATLILLTTLACASLALGDAIHDAARDGNLATVQTLLKDNPALVSAKDLKGATPLHWAARSGHKDVAQLLVSDSADVNAKDGDGDAPLHWAVREDHKDVAEFLLANKADVNAQNYNGWTPLAMAAWKGHIDMAELLLANKANVNARDYIDFTPLHEAASMGHKEMVEFLLAHGADINAHSDKGGLTPLNMAKVAIANRQQVVELLQQRGAQEGTPLRNAIPEGEPTSILRGGGICFSAMHDGAITIKCRRDNFLSTFFVSTTPSLHRIDGRGPQNFGNGKHFNSSWDRGFKVPITAGRHSITVAFFAGTLTMVSMSAEQTVAFVAETGHTYTVDSFAGGGSGWFPILFDTTDKAEKLVPSWGIPDAGEPIHDAAADGDVEKVAALLKDSPGRAFTKDTTGATALHWAAHNDRKAVAELLLANNANVDAKDHEGWTPLFTATMYGHKDIVELLLANKADLRAKTTHGATPLHAAAASGNKDIAELFLANKAEVDATLNDGETPLHLAAVSGNKDVAELLLSNKAGVNVKSDAGVTPLHYAAGRGYKDVAEVLLANGADVNARDNVGKTPLGYAKHFKHVAELLRQHDGHE
jgi:ankyrin repeat protein